MYHYTIGNNLQRFSRMELVSFLYQMKMYLFQDQNNIGNISVRLMCIFDLLPCVTVNIMLVHLADYCNFVDAMTCLVCYTFLSCAEIDSVRYIFSFLTVTFGQVMKNPCLISAIEVYFVGLKMFSR